MLLRDEEIDILSHFSQEEYKRIREIIIKMVLATDMANHASNLSQLKVISDKMANSPFMSEGSGSLAHSTS